MRGADEQLGHLWIVGRVLVLVGAGGPFLGVRYGAKFGLFAAGRKFSPQRAAKTPCFPKGIPKRKPRFFVHL